MKEGLKRTNNPKAPIRSHWKDQLGVKNKETIDRFQEMLADNDNSIITEEEAKTSVVTSKQSDNFTFSDSHSSFLTDS